MSGSMDHTGSHPARVEDPPTAAPVTEKEAALPKNIKFARTSEPKLVMYIETRQ